jgi:hypothetical protein
MPAVTLNGVSYNGTMQDARNNSGSVRIMPQDISRTFKQYGTTLVAPNGVRTKILRASRSDWKLEWKQTTELTVGSIGTVALLSTAWTAVILGASLTVIAEDGDYEQTLALVTPDGTRWWDVSLTLHET